MAASATKFRLCEYEKPVKGPNGEQWRSYSQSWLPERFARVGQVVKLCNDGEWSDGWRVTGVGSTVRDGESLNKRSRDHLKTRNASDI